MSLEFAGWLRERLSDRYLAEIDVARTVGVTPRLVRQWLDGLREPSETEDLQILARMLDVSVDEVHRHLPAGPTPAGDALLLEGEVERLEASHADDLDELPAAFRQAVLRAQAIANAQPATDET